MRYLARNFLIIFLFFYLPTAGAYTDQEIQQYQNLKFEYGPRDIKLSPRATVLLPSQEYRFLNDVETKKYNQILHNLPVDGETSVHTENWQAYFTFSEDGYIKDNEKIDADEILKEKKRVQELVNKELLKKGWSPQSIVGWHTHPFYNVETNRLEWAIIIRDNAGNESINYETRLLGRRGVTRALLVVSEANLDDGIRQFNRFLGTFNYVDGEKYSEFKQGDRIAEYGLVALITGGAAALATKKGFWAAIGGFFAAMWKIIIPIFIVIIAKIGDITRWIKSLFDKK